MPDYILRRTIALVPVFFFTTAIVFLIIHLVPGDPIDNLLRVGSGPDQRLEIARRYGLDKNLLEQYLIWMGRLLHGDMGTAIVMQRPVADLIGANIGYSLTLGGFAILFSAVVGVFFGALAAAWRDTWLDRGVMAGVLLGSTMPTFYLGLLMIMLFAVELGWFPVAGARSWSALVLPVLTVGLGGMTLVARVTRIAMVEVSRQDFILLLHAKGVPSWQIQIRHILRHALIPVVTILSLRIGLILGGAVTVEYVFSRPGLGSLLIRALGQRDYPVVQGALLMLSSAVILGTYLGDILQAAMDPRQRGEKED